MSTCVNGSAKRVFVMTDERRQYDRVVFKVEAELTVQGSSSRAEEISNLSLGGCLLPISEGLAPGTTCQVKIKMGGACSELTLRLKGEVLRSNEKGVAIKFINLDPDCLLHLQNIVRHHAPYSQDAAKEFQFKRGLI